MSAYGNIAVKTDRSALTYLPIRAELKSGLRVRLVSYDPKYESDVFEMLKEVVEEGQTYPQETMDTLQDFRAYYVSHDCFVCVSESTDELLGSFYVKPNFPGRCSHVCNGGFLVRSDLRGLGVGSFMAEKYLRIARDLGYEGSFFNLVFVSNHASIQLWRKLGFQETGRLPRAGRLRGLGYVDAAQYYYDLTTLSPSALDGNSTGEDFEPGVDA